MKLVGLFLLAGVASGLRLRRRSGGALVPAVPLSGHAAGGASPPLLDVVDGHVTINGESKYRIQRVDHFRSRSTLDFTAQEVLTFLGTPSAIRYAATRSQPLRDIDGRAAARPGSGIVGTPGGDAGEFILVLQIYETLRGGGF